MPNWCANSMYIKGFNEKNINKIKELKEYIEKEEYPQVFSFFIPCPQELTDTIKGYVGVDKDAEHKKQLASNKDLFGYETWYDFNIANWGTKWDTSEVTIEDSSKDSLLLTFDTAWSPPEAFYNFLHDSGFYVEATFIECGCDFIGYYKAGECESEAFNDGSIDYDADYCYENEISRMESYFSSKGIDHYPAHTGG